MTARSRRRTARRTLRALVAGLALASCWDNPSGPSVPDGRIVYQTTRGGVRGLAVTTPDGLRASPFVTGGEDKPAWAPNFQVIVFERTDPAGYTDLWMRRVSDGEELRLTRTVQRNEHDPSWSPDGGRIAYWMTFFTEGAGTADSIVVANADGVGASAWTPGRDPAWGPDGRIAFVDRAPESGLPAIWLLDEQQRRTRVSAAPTESTAEQEPAWSSTGRLAWVRRRLLPKPGGGFRDEWSIMVQPAPGAPAVAIATDSVALRAPAWSPEGTHLVITASWTGNPELWAMRADGAGRRRVTSSASCDTPPCGNANGSWGR